MKAIEGFLFILLALSVAGCIVSGDPREGGLIGYWATGDAGYQNRIEQRRAALATQQQAQQQAAARREELEVQKKQQSEKVAQLEQLRNSMGSELAELEKEVNKLSQLSSDKAAEKDQLVAHLTTFASRLEAIRKDPAESVAESEERLQQLQEEMKELRRKASMLLGQ